MQTGNPQIQSTGGLGVGGSAGGQAGTGTSGQVGVFGAGNVISGSNSIPNAVYALKFQAVRTSYTITATDVTNGVTAPITVTFGTAFADTNYTVAQAINDTTADSASSNDYSPGDYHSKAAGGFTTVVYVGPGALAGEVIIVNSIAIHD